MAKELADKRITINATPNEVLEFLQKLSSDEEFRARFQASPSEVLAEYHLQLPVEDLPAEAILPDAGALKKALDTFTQNGELNLAADKPGGNWPQALFWWLYYTPEAKPMAPCAGSGGVKTATPGTPAEEAAYGAKVPRSRIGLSATPRELFEFLMKLASDDQFRARLASDPNEVLAEYHIYVPAQISPARVILPKKEDLQRSLLQLMSGQASPMLLLPWDPSFHAELSWLASFLAFAGPRR